MDMSKMDFAEEKCKSDNISKENLKSSVVQSLLSQNEDLSARLKVAHQRLSTNEDRNQSLEEENLQLRQSHNIMSDQILIWKEKENSWKSRNEGISKELQTFKNRFPDYLKMEETIERYKRYHERVKTQIKPYIQELKNYAQTLHSQIIDLHSELEKKDHEINSLQRKNQEVRNYFNLQIEIREQAQKQLTADFETIREQLQHENTALQEANALLNSKSLQMNRALERQDELENLVIALRRAKDDHQKEIHSEIEELRSQNSDYKRLVAERDLLFCDFKNEMQRLRDTVSKSETRKVVLEGQLANLKTILTNSGDENKKLKLSLESMERINLELSNRLKDFNTTLNAKES